MYTYYHMGIHITSTFKNKTTHLYKNNSKNQQLVRWIFWTVTKNICDAKVIQRKSWLVNDGVVIGKQGKKPLQSGPLRWFYMELWGPYNGRS